MDDFTAYDFTPEGIRENKRIKAQIHHQNREILFENEKFIISTSQAVSLAAIVGIISQIENLELLLSPLIIKIILSVFTATVTSSVLAAYYKHEYKKYDLKLSNSNTQEECQMRFDKMGHYLQSMRRCITSSVVCLIAGFYFFAIGIWLN